MSLNSYAAQQAQYLDAYYRYSQQQAVSRAQQLNSLAMAQSISILGYGGIGICHPEGVMCVESHSGPVSEPTCDYHPYAPITSKRGLLSRLFSKIF